MNTTYVSPSIEKVLGFTIEERMQQSLVDQLTPETLATTAEILFNELENDPEGDPDRSISLDLYYYHKDGSVRCLETRLSFVRDERGVPSGIYGLSRDVTERKRAQEALSRAEEKYRQLFDLESDAIFLIDNETGRILEANNAASLLYGYTREELHERKNRDLSAEPEETRDATRKELGAVPLRYHRKKDGTVFAVDIRATHLTWNGRRSHLAAIRDITERKRAEEAPGKRKTSDSFEQRPLRNGPSRLRRPFYLHQHQIHGAFRVPPVRYPRWQDMVEKGLSKQRIQAWGDLGLERGLPRGQTRRTEIEGF
jgi:PAS domain S-box-containing protein